ARIALAGLLALNLPFAFADRSDAQVVKALDTFQCEKVQGYHATMAVQHSGQRAPMIVWASQEFSDSGYTPERRCREVTQRLNQALEENGGRLQNLFLTVGPVNRHMVLCHVSNTRRGCNRNNVLFTLSQSNRRAENPTEMLSRMFNTEALSSGNPIQQSGGQPYVSLETLVNGLF
ncbi:MAG: COP23 domain-containing protein, partial [Cyanobacteria bacterium P01_D01_bin.73]